MPAIMSTSPNTFPYADSSINSNDAVFNLPFPQPLLELSCTFSSPALDSKLNSADNVSNMWAVLTKCKDVVKDGRRLENVCWRLWHQACVNSHASGSGSGTGSSRSQTPVVRRDYATELDSEDGYSTISSGSSSASSASVDDRDEVPVDEAEEEEEGDWESESELGAGGEEAELNPGTNAKTPARVSLVERGKPVLKDLRTGSDEGPEDEDDEDGFVTTDGEDEDEEVEAEEKREEQTVPTPVVPAAAKKPTVRPDMTRRRSSNKDKNKTGLNREIPRPAQIVGALEQSSKDKVGSSNMISSTPKASSYPTPLGSLVDAKYAKSGNEVTRTRSHLEDVTARQGIEDSRAEIGSSARKLRWDGKAWSRETPQMKAERERSFGQVLDLVFNKTDGTVDVQEMCRNVVTARRGSTSTGRGAGSPSGGAAEVETGETLPAVQVADCSVSPRTTGPGWEPGADVSIGGIEDSHQSHVNESKASSLTTAPSSLGGLEVRVQGPTPVPSRVGSLGDTTAPTPPKSPFGSVMHSPLALPRIHESASGLTGSALAAVASRSAGLVPMSTITSPPRRVRSVSDRSRRSQSPSDKSNMSRSPVYSPQVEKEDPMATMIAGPSRMSNEGSRRRERRSSKGSSGGSSEQRLSTSALRRLAEMQVDQPSSDQAAPAARKKGKKSMFFIHSPGDRRRHGSVSASAVSEGSTDAGSTLADGSIGTTRVTASPGRPRSVGRPGTSPLTCHISASDQSTEQLPITSAEVMTSSPQPLAGVVEPSKESKPPVTSGLRRKSSGASRGPARRASTETKPAITKTLPAHAQVQRLHAPKRVPSASNMAGKFAGEKAKAAAAIAARLEAQQQQEKERQQQARSRILDMKRQKSEPDFLGAQARAAQQHQEDEDESFETVDDAEDDDDSEDNETGWSSASDSPERAENKKNKRSAKDAPLSVKGKAVANKPAVNAQSQQAKAAEEAQRKRELFAKRAIFGNSGQSSLSLSRPEPAKPESAIPSRPGLLSNLFETQRDVLQRGESMADLTQTPPHKHDPSPSALAPTVGGMHRSKSAAAIPAMTGVSIGRGGMMDQVAVIEAAEATKQQPDQGRSKFRLPPKPVNAADLSPSSSPEEDSNILQPSSVALRRLEAISGRRQQSERSKSGDAQSGNGNPALQRLTSGLATPTVSSDTAGQSQPVPATTLSAPQPDLALPQTPTTRRRQMLATELPEDLRLNLIWERKSRAPMYPMRKSSGLRPTASAQDLPETARQAQTDETPGLTRQQTEPAGNISDGRLPEPSVTKRRTSHNLLGGGSGLRPLTSGATATCSTQPSSERSTDDQSAGPAPLASNLANSRSKSTADMSHWHRSRMNGSESADYTNRLTEGEQEVHNDWVRARRLRQREGELSSSFRSHGW